MQGLEGSFSVEMEFQPLRNKNELRLKAILLPFSNYFDVNLTGPQKDVTVLHSRRDIAGKLDPSAPASGHDMQSEGEPCRPPRQPRDLPSRECSKAKWVMKRNF